MTGDCALCWYAVGVRLGGGEMGECVEPSDVVSHWIQNLDPNLQICEYGGWSGVHRCVRRACLWVLDTEGGREDGCV